MDNKGKFIVIEGIDGSGKGTVTAAIKEHFLNTNTPLTVTREPGGTPVAEMIRNIAINNHDEKINPRTELLLMMASRCQHIHGRIIPAMNQGKWVLSERFLGSSVAYQGCARGMGEDFVEDLYYKYTSDLLPDLTIVLDIPVEVSIQRARARGSLDRIEQESYDFFNLVRNSYLKQAKKSPENHIVIDATMSVDSVVKQALGAIKLL